MDVAERQRPRREQRRASRCRAHRASSRSRGSPSPPRSARDSTRAYTIVVARGSILSYFDHPPLHQWIAHFAALPLGEGAATRLPFIALVRRDRLADFALTRRLFGARAGLIALVRAQPHAVLLRLRRQLGRARRPAAVRAWRRRARRWRELFFDAPDAARRLAALARRRALARPRRPVEIQRRALRRWASSAFVALAPAPAALARASRALSGGAGRAGVIAPVIRVERAHTAGSRSRSRARAARPAGGWRPAPASARWRSARSPFCRPGSSCPWRPRCRLARGARGRRAAAVPALPRPAADRRLHAHAAVGRARLAALADARLVLRLPLLGAWLDRRLRGALGRLQRWAIASAALLARRSPSSSSAGGDGLARRASLRLRPGAVDPTLETFDWGALRAAPALNAGARFRRRDQMADGGKIALALGPDTPVFVFSDDPRGMALLVDSGDGSSAATGVSVVRARPTCAMRTRCGAARFPGFDRRAAAVHVDGAAGATKSRWRSFRRTA